MPKVRQWELQPNVGVHVHRHEDGTRVAYEAGEVIHDHRDLDAMFPNKFAEIGVSKPQTKKKVSKIKSSPHLAAQQAVDLEKVDDEADDADDVVETSTEEADTEEVESAFGEEVTASFPAAAKADLKVFFDKKKKVHTVVDSDTPDKPLGKALKKPKNVEKWIKTYLKGK